MKNKVYDALKWVNLVALPAGTVFYITVGNLWGFPATEPVVGTIAASEVLLGALLGISSTKYKKANEISEEGSVNIADSEDGASFLISFAGDPTEFQNGQKVLFTVNRSSV